MSGRGAKALIAKRDARELALLQKWREIPNGTRVIVRRDDGTDFHTEVRSGPWRLSSGHPVILLDGITGGYDLERVRRADEVVPLKGLSLTQPFASLVAVGLKPIETRPTRIHYRGDLVICATRSGLDTMEPRLIEAVGAAWRELKAWSWPTCWTAPAFPLGCTLALVTVVGCRPLVPEDWPSSFAYAPGRWAWILENPRRLKPKAVRGMNGLFPVDPALVELDPGG